MGEKIRNWDERRRIIRAIIAETTSEPVSEFNLTTNEEVFYRSRAGRTIDLVARKTSDFKAVYSLPVSRPFRYVIAVATILALGSITAGSVLIASSTDKTDYNSLIAACATIAVATIGWGVTAWISHRNAVRQITSNIIFARFSQATYTEALHNFHHAFGYKPEEKVSRVSLDAQRVQGEHGARRADAALYLLNYFEHLAGGVMCGDLDANVVRQNLRGIISYYYDKCEPLIMAANTQNRRAFANLMKIRLHYREP